MTWRRRWPHTTQCCAARSSRTEASGSSTRVTVCAPRSPRQGGSAVDAAVAAQRAWRRRKAKCQKASDHDAENRELTDPIKHAR